MGDDEMTFVPMPRYLMRKNALCKLLKKELCDGKRLLEIGYGAGEIFTLYRNLNLQVEGYDFSEAAYEYARAHYAGNDVMLLKDEKDIGGGV